MVSKVFVDMKSNENPVLVLRKHFNIPLWLIGTVSRAFEKRLKAGLEVIGGPQFSVFFLNGLSAKKTMHPHPHENVRS